MSTSLVVTDEVFIADDEDLVELTFGCDTTHAYDAMVKLSNMVSKNAKCQNHMEDILNNLKLFVETNVGKLTRLTSALDESNRTLQGQVARLTEELRVVREQSLRKEEYEVDIRRVKNQLAPCVTFLDEVATKKNYGLDVYIRELLRNDVPTVFLKPLLGEVQQRIATAVDGATNQMAQKVHTKHEEVHSVLTKQSDRVDVELRTIQTMLAEVVGEREAAQAAVNETLASMTTRVDDSLSAMKEEWTSQSKHVTAELQSLDERHKKVVELLGFREAPRSSPFPASATGAAPPGRRGDASPGSAAVGSVGAHQQVRKGEAFVALLGGSVGASSSPATSLGVSSLQPQEVCEGEGGGATADYGPTRPTVPEEAVNNSSMASSGRSASANAAAAATPFAGGDAAAASLDSSSVEALFYSELESIGRRGSMVVRGEDPNRTLAASTGSTDRPPTLHAHPDLVASPTGTRLISRGKSIANMSDPEAGTGLFSSQLFQSLMQHVTDTSYAAVCSLEERFKMRVDALVQRWEGLLEEKVDLAAVRHLLLDAPAPRDNHLYHVVDGLQKQLDALKRLKTDVQEVKHRIDNKAESSVVAGKANQNDLDAQKKEMERSFQEVSASILQINHVMRKSEGQMKLFHDSLADQGLLLAPYNSKDNNAAGSDAGSSPASAVPQASQFPGGPKKGRYGGSQEQGFPQQFRGTNTPTRQQVGHRGVNTPASGGRGQPHPNSATGSGSRDDVQSARTYNDNRPLRKPGGGHGGNAQGPSSGGHGYGGSQQQFPSIGGGPMRNSNSAGWDRGGAPSEVLPGLHEVVFGMTDQDFAEHKRRNELDRKLVVAPRPPSK